MNKKITRFIRYWLPAIVWMIVIFSFSSHSRFHVSDDFNTSFFVFKTLHLIEYAALYFLLFRGFYSISSKKLSLNKKMIIPIFLSILYAASDEFHQSFTPTREPSPRDVIIDTCGIILMYIYIRNNLKFTKKFI